MIFPLKTGKEWTLPPAMYNYFDKEYPLIDIDTELNKMRRWLDCTPARRKTAGGMKRAINFWLGNDKIEKAKRKPKVDRTAQFEMQCGDWLRHELTDLFQINSNAGFKARLGDAEFRVWAEGVNVFVKEITI